MNNWPNKGERNRLKLIPKQKGKKKQERVIDRESQKENIWRQEKNWRKKKMGGKTNEKQNQK